ncbi:MAG: hypothetical protein A2741_00055 [Candidatus Zambryskibacteria bacterium RIFCSPHIGHO2_01_FULL_43_27]|uniref:N-acetyltransferase domain-containing protein n=1 Tax=Candidatus Zambryskibacteria bacterium RIFCSPLOWO2_01_FULL_43_17 TaxID=1802760 RepID=A0A1G2U702_9BACT|nr:MAG: hypothetical protein A2741_00055 [Candidatus Zambryskibacteria bacterium RIFCSPHIGHO2_01_FULL_43_27]OHA99479.1 MAG: hypothetical protein A3E93_02785 [Candidatus Zambryskibacteria bacterium RIFCSPHIGHO2_12_FULL_43_12b]OHB04780.1 MAG: hypothetical protein A2920_00735 [Candidatus Zambryskibacteria bacterium RIFCSPLOWO2_01_FULL_43_17]
MFKGEVRQMKQEDLPRAEAILALYWSGELKDRFVKRMRDFVAQTEESIEQKYKYVVAEEGGEVVGMAALRKAPQFMSQFTTTSNPAEFYIAAVKYKEKGIGFALREERIKEARRLGFTEAVFFSAESHKDSWNFHDDSEFKRMGKALSPNGEGGQVWGMIL